MKLKEKDKDKDKDDGGGGGGGAKKSSAAKEKQVVKQAQMQMQAQQGNAELIEAERASPQTMAKRKSSSIDIISMPTGAVMGGSEPLIGVKQLAPLSNGGVMLGNDDKAGGVGVGMDSLDALVDRNGGTNPLEVGESFDSGNEMSLNNNSINNNNNSEKSVLDLKTHGSIQVSQV